MVGSRFSRRGGLLLLALPFTLTLLAGASPFPEGQRSCGYSLEASSGTYQEIAGTVLFDGAAPANDEAYRLAIPFPFTFCRNTYTTVTLSTNGYISFEQIGTSPANAAIPSIVPPNNIMAPWWDDLQVSDFGGAANASISYSIDGASPLRVITIQYKSVAGASDSASDRHDLNFQVTLHETTNRFEFRYGAGSASGAPPALSASAGIEGADGMAGLVALSGTPDLTVAEFPASGTIISFKPGMYSTSQFASTYTPVVGTPIWDATVQPRNESTSDIALPFGFVFWGRTYQTARLSTNGFLSFGSTVAEPSNPALPDAADPNSVLAPWWDDLVIENFGGQPGIVSTSISGSAPSRVLTIQSANVSRFGDTASDFIHLNFQVRLHETSNVIDFVYGPKSSTGAPGASTATAGIENQDGSDALVAVASSPLADYAAFPPSGTVIRFAPMAYVLDEIVETYTPIAGNALWSGSVNPVDDAQTTVSLPFDFRYFEQARSVLRVSSNGYLTFGANGATFINKAIPAIDSPNDLIAPWWDDLRVASGFGANDLVEWTVSGAPPLRTLTIEYQDISRVGNNSANYHSLNFQVRLSETSDAIDLIYGPGGVTGSPSSAISASAGIENADGSIGHEALEGSPSLGLADFPPPGTRLRLTPCRPDLIVTAFAASVEGGSVTYTVTILNHGGAATGVGFTGQLFRDRPSPPGLGQSGDAVLSFPAIAPGEFAVAQSVQSPIASGQYQSWFVVDGAVNSIRESIEFNNRSAPLPVEVQPAPDLQITNLTAQPLAGGSVDYAVTVKNNGAVGTGAAFDVVLVFDSAIPPTQSDAGDMLQTIGPLGAGASQIVNFQRASTPPGVYNSYAYADGGMNRIAESSETNNTGGPTTVRVQPDLRITGFSAGFSGTDLVYDVTVTNSGVADATIPVGVHLFYDRPSSPNQADAGEATLMAGPLAAGASQGLQFIRPAVPGGTYQSWCYADGGSSLIAETDESNNVGGPLTVVARPDLVVTSFDVTATGSSVEYVVNIRNQGPLSTIDPFRVELFRDRSSAPGQSDSGDDFAVLDPLGPGESIAVPFSLDPAPDGTFKAWCYVDGKVNNIGEANEANNVAGPEERTIGIDLVVEVFIPFVSAGDVNYLVTVRNRGSVAAEDKFDVHLFRNQPGAPGQTDAGDDSQRIFSLGAGQTEALTFILPNAPLGSFIAWCYVDGGENQSPEVNETNNVAGPAPYEVRALAARWELYE